MLNVNLLLLSALVAFAPAVSREQALAYQPPGGAECRPFTSQGRRIRDEIFADLSGDSRLERARVFVDSSGVAGGVEVEFKDSAAWSRYAGFTRPDYFPFRIRAGDLDHDGEPEIAVGLFDQAQRGRPGYAMKFHLFDLRQGRLVPRWFCEREVTDFTIARLNGRFCLITLETQGGWTRLRAYSWDSFGFQAIGLPVRFKGIARFDRDGDNITVVDRRGWIFMRANDESAWGLAAPEEEPKK